MNSPDPRLVNLVQWLVNQGGGYLRNTVWLPGTTCATCATPVDDRFDNCYPCNSAAQSYPDKLADLVGSLFYGVQGHQSGYLMRQYKSATSTDLQRQILSAALNATLHLHFDCIEQLVGSRPDLMVIVPSTNGRIGPHPLEGVVGNALLGLPVLLLDSSERQPGNQHQIIQGLFRLQYPMQIRGKHVLIIDDTWTAGGNEQSAALTLKLAGASTVTVLTLARWLNPSFGDNRAFISTHLVRDFSPTICPFGYSKCRAGNIMGS